MAWDSKKGIQKCDTPLGSVRWFEGELFVAIYKSRRDERIVEKCRRNPKIPKGWHGFRMWRVDWVEWGVVS